MPEHDPPIPAAGPTGKFPDGVLNADDEGELCLHVGHDALDGLVHISFGTPIAWLSMSPPDIEQFARLLLRHAGAKMVTIEF